VLHLRICFIRIFAERKDISMFLGGFRRLDRNIQKQKKQELAVEFGYPTKT
jgi:hypothetical protein